jgi:hypothetical protein
MCIIYMYNNIANQLIANYVFYFLAVAPKCLVAYLKGVALKTN